MVSCYKQTTYQPSSRTETVNSAVHAVQRVQRVTKTLCCARHKSPHIRIRAGRRSVSRPARVPATCDKAPRRVFTRHPQDQLTKSRRAGLEPLTCRLRIDPGLRMLLCDKNYS